MGTEAESVRSAMPMELEKGVCYLVKEKKPELSYRLFETLVAQKIPGLCITRQYPERVRRERGLAEVQDRKSTRLNSSHSSISYAVFCLKKKKKKKKKNRSYIKKIIIMKNKN